MAKHASLWWLLPILVILPAVQAFPQTVVNPRTLEFAPSADQNALTSSGQPMVTRYDLVFYQKGAAQPYRTVDLGKPAADSVTGKIAVDFSTKTGWPLPNGTYQVRVIAVGPTGSGSSDLSNSFTFASTLSVSSACAYTVWPATVSVGAGGGAPAAAVTTTPGCDWTATSRAVWIAPGPASGRGGGTVTLTVRANTGHTGRVGTVTVGGQIVTVLQAPPDCAFSVSPSVLSIAASAGTWSVAVTAGAGCPWTAAGDVGWIALSPTVGNGSGVAALAVPANTAPTSRVGRVTIAGRTVSVTQAGGGGGCSYGISPTRALIDADGGASSVLVRTSAGCDWSVTTAADWIAISSRSGRGNAQVSLTAAANAKAVRRSSTVTIAGRPFTLTQRGGAERREKPARPGKPRIIIHSG